MSAIVQGFGRVVKVGLTGTPLYISHLRAEWAAMNAHDVAAYLLGERGRIPAIKLHKLLYYSQAWSLVWDDRPLFNDKIEAWANGPVVPTIYRCHRGSYYVMRDGNGDPDKLNQDARETVNAVLEFYGDRSSAELSSLTHSEDPWKNARAGLLPGQQSRNVITRSAMAEYYSSLIP